MLDLTNYEHRRGVMILNSKDVRTVDKNLSHWKVDSMCIDAKLDIIEQRLEMHSNSMKDYYNATVDLDSVFRDLESIRRWIQESQKNIERARSVFQ